MPELEAIEQSGIFTNYGPVNTELEAALTEQCFGGAGGCVTMNNATVGLILAVREAILGREGRRYAVLPSFTFAATAHAALWSGLTPLFCDIDGETWALSEDRVEALLKSRAGEIACVIPYAPFGSCIDLGFYERIAREYDVGVVVDAAPSLGSLDSNGKGFGSGCAHAVVFSMHATKLFGTAEAGVIHCGDPERLAKLRAMGNFGFRQPRLSELPGLNAKLSEVGALLAVERLRDFDRLVADHVRQAETYKSALHGLTFQRTVGKRIARMFMPVLLPSGTERRRAAIVDGMLRKGIQLGQYFSPHLWEHPYFRGAAEADTLDVTDEVASRVLSLPMADGMSGEELEFVCAALIETMEHAVA